MKLKEYLEKLDLNSLEKSCDWLLHGWVKIDGGMEKDFLVPLLENYFEHPEYIDYPEGSFLCFQEISRNHLKLLYWRDPWHSSDIYMPEEIVKEIIENDR